MAVQFKATGVPLFKTTGVVAMDVDCCCDLPPCVCDVGTPEPTACNCQTEDYGSYKNFSTITVTITGTATPTAATSPGCSAPASCADVTGTYVMACADSRDQHYRVDQYVCTDGTWDYYYANTLRIFYQIGTPIAIAVRLGSNKVRIPTGDPNPYPTLTSWAGPQPSGAGSVLYEHRFEETPPLRQRWQYVLGGDCREECNTSLGIVGCNVTTGTVTLTTSYISGNASTDNVCHPASHSVSVSVAVPV